MTKKIIKLLTLYIMFFMIAGCGKGKVETNTELKTTIELETTTEEYLPTLAGDCFVSSFMEGVSKGSVYYGNTTYIIKGIVLDEYEYGLNIRLIEDLKGNFPENVNTFTVWGEGIPFLESNRMDKMSWYATEDILIMHITPARDLSEMTGHTWLEKPEDYTTITCTFSVLKLSDGYVTGYILPYEEKDKWWEGMSSEEMNLALANSPYANYGMFGFETMPLEDFQKKLNELLVIK